MQSTDHLHGEPTGHTPPRRTRRKISLRTALRIGAATAAAGALATTAALTLLTPANASTQAARTGTTSPR
jgi:hypothetical protein